jgi:hypothetical protein
MLVAAVIEALLAVSRKPVWMIERRHLRLVEGGERRTRTLPFVGSERRVSRWQELESDEQRRRA